MAEEKITTLDQRGSRHPSALNDNTHSRGFLRDRAGQGAAVSKTEARVKAPAGAVPPAK